MKNLLVLLLIIMSFGLLSVAPNPAREKTIGVPSEYIYVKLKNECSHSVKYEYKYSNGGASGAISANYQRQITLQVGAKLYIDGKLIKEIEKSDDKQIIIVCK